MSESVVTEKAKTTTISHKGTPTFSPLDSKIQYGRILVPHDGSAMSDRALKHAVYLSRISGAEIVILHVLENRENIPPSTLLAFIKPETPLGKANEELTSLMERGVRQMLEERTRLCKEAGVKEASYIIRTGSPVHEIVNLVEERYYDIIVMASNRISSAIRVLGSTVRRVLDSIPRPILIIH